MGGRGSKSPGQARARLLAPVPEEPLLPPDATFRPDEDPAEAPAPEPGQDDLAPVDPPTEQAPAPEPEEERPEETEPKPPVSGWPSDKPLLPNEWGTFPGPDTPIAYHDDGEIGSALKAMPSREARMDVDGEPLANVLGKLATDVRMGRKTPQEGVDAYKELRDRLPERSQARFRLDMALQRIDAPPAPPPELPKDTPAPLRRLAADLNEVPLARADPKELTKIRALADDLAAGKPVRLRQEVEWLRNTRHESQGDAGKFQIDDAVQRAVQALEDMGRSKPT
ncbi:hypothetical protein [Actinophytocola sp.]|uniref:hypothetical protein n=1 Tax=Actinophytocola sp. TaxID=1872138 RepID=UPI002D756AFE|nr:hypothetical protein [Actinophytocola sp.]HYQ66153.1 hypothetical protein [Actinophytocola sp.]